MRETALKEAERSAHSSAADQHASEVPNLLRSARMTPRLAQAVSPVSRGMRHASCVMQCVPVQVGGYRTTVRRFPVLVVAGRGHVAVFHKRLFLP